MEGGFINEAVATSEGLGQRFCFLISVPADTCSLDARHAFVYGSYFVRQGAVGCKPMQVPSVEDLVRTIPNSRGLTAKGIREECCL